MPSLFDRMIKRLFRSLGAKSIVTVTVTTMLVAIPVPSQSAPTANIQELPDFVKIYPEATLRWANVKPETADLNGKVVHITLATIRFATDAPISAVVSFYEKQASSVHAVVDYDSASSNEDRVVTFARKTPHFTIGISAFRPNKKTSVALFYEVVR